MIEALHLALVRRGVAVAKGTSYDPFDLRIIVAPFVRVAVLFLQTGDAVSLGWRIGAAWWRLCACLAVLLAVLVLGDLSLASVLTTTALILAPFAGVALSRAWRLPALIDAASAELISRIEANPSGGPPRTTMPSAMGEAAS
ncbi:MAG: hypothetical protein JO166_06060 [Deltaproteobacteria bacterium]|nr:hypothetical protein [Deltaproteobacteria bacterium]